MKFETLNGVLTFVLGVLVVLAVYFALKMILMHHELRALQREAAKDQAMIVRTQQIFNDAAAYNQKYPNPDLTRILQILQQPKPATH
jgi:hypothetical protein